MRLNLAMASIAVVGILSTTCGILAQPAQALGLEDILRGTLKINPGNSAEQNIIRTNFDTRRSQLEAQIQAGVASGQLTPQEESELRNDLNNISNMQNTSMMDGKFDQNETNMIVQAFTNVSTKIETYLTNANVTGTAVNPVSNPYWYRRGLGNGRNRWVQNDTQFRADIDAKQAQLEASITRGTTSGRLNWNEAQRLRNQLNQIHADEARYLADGRLSYNDAKRLTDSLDRLTDEVQRQKRDNQRAGNRYRNHW